VDAFDDPLGHSQVLSQDEFGVGHGARHHAIGFARLRIPRLRRVG
jgi:hypothetical protein